MAVIHELHPDIPTRPLTDEGRAFRVTVEPVKYSLDITHCRDGSIEFVARNVACDRASMESVAFACDCIAEMLRRADAKVESIPTGDGNA